RPPPLVHGAFGAKTAVFSALFGKGGMWLGIVVWSSASSARCMVAELANVCTVLRHDFVLIIY
ncbi:MAG: hypothetical protein ACKPKO_07420, partial [Candidatus Fonsibacter sp.]